MTYRPELMTDWINWENHRFEISPEMLEQWSKVFKQRPCPMVDGDLWLPSETEDERSDEL